MHGLETFFRDPQHAPPPRWKMAIVTWLGVFPSVALWSSTLPKVLTGLPSLVVMAIVNVFVVVTLAWVVMKPTERARRGATETVRRATLSQTVANAGPRTQKGRRLAIPAFRITRR